MSAVNGDYERREITAELRVDAMDGRKIRGYAIVFDSLSQDLGGFKERIMPSAVDRTLSEALDVRALIDHDSSKVIGRTRAGTLEIRKDHRGLRVMIDPPNTSAANDILESIRRGDITGMSFGFRTLEDDWHIEDGMDVRDVTDMRISEVSIVSFPAYTATDVQVATRSLKAFREQREAGMSIEWARKLHQIKLA